MGKGGMMRERPYVWGPRGVAVLFLMALAASPSVGQAEVTVLQASLQEELLEAVNVSGEVLRGVQLQTGSGAKARDVITLYNVKPSDRRLCVSLLSRDGRYRGELFATPNLSAAGAVSLSFRSKYSSLLGQLGSQDLALLARASPSSEQDCVGGEVLAAAFGAAEANAALTLQVNSTIAQVRSRLDRGGGSLSVWGECNRLQGITIAFDTVCRFPQPTDCADSQVVVLRRRGASRFPAVEARVRAVCLGVEP